jgi:hypothetical protein
VEINVKRIIAEKYLRLMSAEDRKQLGGRTWEEIVGAGEVHNERKLQGQIVNLLRLRGIEALWHRSDKRSAATVGWPDITFAYYGKAFVWEIKLPERKLRPEQEKMILALKSEPNRWEVRVIHSVDEALAELYRMQSEKK